MAVSGTRERMLGAAERLFAERGFHGVSLREIATAAEMGLSHLQYHFRSKDDLYHAVFERRILAINHARLARLDRVGQDSIGKPPEETLEDIVRAFIEPAVMISRDRESGGDYYAQLIAQISNEPAEHARRVSRDFTDPIARVTIKALAQALPELDQSSLPWAYIFAVGAMIASISRTGRVRLLSDGACDPDNVSRIVSLLVPFISGGFRAVCEAERARAPSGRLARADQEIRSESGKRKASQPIKRSGLAEAPPPRPSRKRAGKSTHL